jgi:hypothetical protein
MILLVVLFTGIRPRHIKETTQNVLKFIRDPPIIPYIGFKQVKLWTIGVLVPILIIIFVIFLFSLSSIIDQIETTDWVETKATVDFAEEREETTCDAEGNCTTDYWTHVEYIYEYENVTYSGSRYTFLSKMNSGLSGDFPSGKEIDIFVDDKNPHESLMIKGWDGVWIEAVWILEIILFGLSIILACLIVWKIGFHLQSSENKNIALKVHRKTKDEEELSDSENNNGNQELVSKNNWIGPDGTESGPDVSEDWYLTYNGPAPIVEEIYDENYAVDRGNGTVPIHFYIKKWGVPEGFGKTDHERLWSLE